MVNTLKTSTSVVSLAMTFQLPSEFFMEEHVYFTNQHNEIT